MRKVENSEFVAALRPGDIGLIHANNLFAGLQSLYAHRFKEGPYAASHGFLVKSPPQISEANGIIIAGDHTMLKNVGDSTLCWIFRYTKLTPEQLAEMLSYAKAAEQTGGHYSVFGIWEFAKAFAAGNRNVMRAQGGVFCTEYTSLIISSSGITDYITNLNSWQIDPTYQLNWFLKEGMALGWQLAAYWDGKNYLVADDPGIPEVKNIPGIPGKEAA